MKRVIPALFAFLPVMASAQALEGPYIGASLGYMAQEDDGTGYDQGDGAANAWTQETSPKSATLGLLGGYRWQLNDTWIVGVEADYEFRNGSDTSFLQLSGVTDTNYVLKTRNTAAASLRGHAAYLLSEDSLLFFTAGLAAANVERTSYDFPNTDSEKHSAWQTGWTAGLGLEHAYSQNTSARVEYRYADYGTKKVSVDMWNEYYKQDLTEHAIKISVLRRF